MSYLLDANVFIQAKNLHYGFDFCPAFWDWLTTQNQAGKVFSIEEVKNEINAGSDELSDWVNKQDDSFFLKPDTPMIEAFPTVSKWATSQDYKDAVIKEFLDVADYYLVCYGLGHSMTIVTHEVASNSKKRIKIPDACKGLGINFISPYIAALRIHIRTVEIPRQARNDTLRSWICPNVTWYCYSMLRNEKAKFILGYHKDFVFKPI